VHLVHTFLVQVRLNGRYRSNHWCHAGAGSQLDEAVYSCKTKFDADEHAEVHASSDEDSEAEAKEEDESDDGFACDRTKRTIAQVGGTGREQGRVGAVVQATAAGGRLFGLVWVGGPGLQANTSAGTPGGKSGAVAPGPRLPR
jgi:hypothetical protein